MISRSPYSRRLTFIALAALACTPVHAEEYGSIYFYGYLKHANPKPTAHEGGMDLFGLSKELRSSQFRFDTGFNTYIDSYGKRSYGVFSKVSHDDYRYGIVSPMVSLTCTYKGEDYGSDRMRIYCLPLPVIRIGGSSGLFADISALPKVSQYTNGWAAIEVGAKW